LMDHPSISLSSFVKPAARLAGLTRPAHAGGAALFVRNDGGA